MDSPDNKFMQRALELAELGKGSVSPNPMVGCVIVHHDRIIGEGYHEKYGEAHAEVNAINSVLDHSLLSQSTAYVTLEPCAHQGKTPPCADLLIEKRIKKVVIASRDPFEKVDGRGIQKLQDAGVETINGVLEAEAEELNKRFIVFHTKKRPYVILKWAQTTDGFIARENFDSKWISNEKSRQLVHKLRTEEDAILVGKNTAIHDNPSLTTRDWKGKNPVRILLDSNLEVDRNSKLFDDEAKTIIFNSSLEKEEGTNQWVKVDASSPQGILNKLHELRVQSIIIEGGAQTLNSFIKDNCWDEAKIFIGAESFGNGISAPVMDQMPTDEKTYFGDILKTYRN
ncbi:MAG: bifunctional diaminohydroxyphosphoribosylaminopyrimidine deaminase/5-amino-6-(5-phosphoribosylamino)uracil reductase RibD [Cyclobacteriaceae bacterium]